MPVVYIGIGSNKGQRVRNIQESIEKLKEKMIVARVSSLYLSQPVDVKGGWFINCVIMAQSTYSPEDLLRELLRIEENMGRDPRRPGERKEPRIIDLDILLYDQAAVEEKGLIIPHPRLTERRFVLLPLVELDPEITHPIQKKTIKAILEELNDSHWVEKILDTSNGNCQNSQPK